MLTAPPRIDEDLALVAFLAWLRRVNAGRRADAAEPRDALKALGIRVKHEPGRAERLISDLERRVIGACESPGLPPPGLRVVRPAQTSTDRLFLSRHPGSRVPLSCAILP